MSLFYPVLEIDHHLYQSRLPERSVGHRGTRVAVHARAGSWLFGVADQTLTGGFCMDGDVRSWKDLSSSADECKPLQSFKTSLDKFHLTLNSMFCSLLLRSI